MKWGVDREQIVKALFAGYGTVGNDHPIPKTDPYYNSSLPQVHYDPDKAKFYAKKAGMAAITIQASDAAFNGAVDMATLMQASANKAGLKVDVKKEPADGFWDNVWLKGPCVTSYWAGRSAATQMLSVAYGPDAPWNESHCKDAALRQTAAGGARRDRRDEAQGDDLGLAGDAARRRRDRGAGVPRLGRRQQQERRRAHAAWRLRHG